MLGVVLRLVPALPWLSVAGAPPQQQHMNDEQIAITSCISAVKSYFPCRTTSTPDYACLCDQYLWRVSCYENHASGPWAHTDRASTERSTKDICRAAGSVEADKVGKEHLRQKRQIGDLLSSIVGDVSSVLSSKGVTVPTAVIESVAGGVVNALPTPANPTSIAAAITATSAVGGDDSSIVSTETGSPSSTRGTASGSSSQESASSTSTNVAAASPLHSDSKPSPGLIAGVVVGAIAALALIGIFILLLLRHRRKTKYQNSSPFTDKEASPTFSPSFFDSATPQHNISSPTPTATVLPMRTHTTSARPEPALLSPVSPITPSGDQAFWTSPPSTSTRGILPRYSSSASSSSSSSNNTPLQPHHYLDAKGPQVTEMPTTANAWELDGREIRRPSELDAGQGYSRDRRSSIEDCHKGEFIGNEPVGRAL